MVIGVFFMLLGALGLVVALQWQYGRWLESARWIARNASVHVLYATPMAGLFLGCLGLSVIWPPGIVLVFLAAGAFLFMLLASPHRRRMQAERESMVSAHGPRARHDVSGRPFMSRAASNRRVDRTRTDVTGPRKRESGTSPEQERKRSRRAS